MILLCISNFLQRSTMNFLQRSTGSIYVLYSFRSWEKRVAVYKARKKLDNINVLLDLTPKRAKLFSAARERVKSHSRIQFAFVDSNCRLDAKLADDSLKFFSSESELDKLL